MGSVARNHVVGAKRRTNKSVHGAVQNANTDSIGNGICAVEIKTHDISRNKVSERPGANDSNSVSPISGHQVALACKRSTYGVIVAEDHNTRRIADRQSAGRINSHVIADNLA